MVIRKLTTAVVFALSAVSVVAPATTPVAVPATTQVPNSAQKLGQSISRFGSKVVTSLRGLGSPKPAKQGQAPAPTPTEVQPAAPKASPAGTPAPTPTKAQPAAPKAKASPAKEKNPRKEAIDARFAALSEEGKAFFKKIMIQKEHADKLQDDAFVEGQMTLVEGLEKVRTETEAEAGEETDTEVDGLDLTPQPGAKKEVATKSKLQKALSFAYENSTVITGSIAGAAVLVLAADIVYAWNKLDASGKQAGLEKFAASRLAQLGIKDPKTTIKVIGAVAVAAGVTVAAVKYFKK